MCTFCLWPQTHSGHRWRLRSAQDIAAECKYTLECISYSMAATQKQLKDEYGADR